MRQMKMRRFGFAWLGLIAISFWVAGCEGSLAGKKDSGDDAQESTDQGIEEIQDGGEWDVETSEGGEDPAADKVEDDPVSDAAEADGLDALETPDAPRDGRADSDVDVEGENRPPVCECDPTPIETTPLQTITLSAAGCSDPDGDLLRYAWTLIQIPPGSTAQPQTPDQRETRFFVDLAGTYVFGVTATDPSGGQDWCQLTVHSVPSDALHLQLVWDRDVTDLDIHLLNPTGSINPRSAAGWFNLANDCHYANRTPDWGVIGNSADNARLDLDDLDGYGPENLNIASPAAGTYTIGVHYYCDHSLGTSQATVRVYCNGTLAAELGGHAMAATRVFWEVATVTWPGCTISEINQDFTSTSGCTF